MGHWFFSAIIFICFFLYKTTCLNDLSVTVHPEDVTAHLGQTVRLACEFNQVKSCIWLRRNSPVEIGDRYSLVELPKCTIEINNVEDIDFGEWICGASDGDTGLVKSNAAILSEKKILDVRMHSKGENNSVIKIELNDNRVLICGELNEGATDYAWEYRDVDSDNWKRYVSAKIVDLKNATVSFFRCSATASGQRIYSNEYLITFLTKVDNTNTVPRPILFLGIGFSAIIGVIALAAIIIAFNYLRRGKRQNVGVFNTLRNLLKHSATKTSDEENVGLLKAEQFSERNQRRTQFEELVAARRKNYEQDKTKSTTSFDWTVSNYVSLKNQQENAQNNIDYIESEVFQIKETELKMQLRLYLNGYARGYGSYISASLKFVNSADRAPSVPGAVFYHRRTIMILDQSGIKEDKKNHIYFVFEVPFGSNLTESWMKELWAKHRFVRKRLIDKDNSPYIKNDTLKLRVIIEPLSLLWKNIDFYDGVLFWKIPNYAQQKINEKKGVFQCLRSKDFYTGPYGYRCKVSFFLNGNGNGNRHHMSIYLGFIKGEWDDELPKPFAYRVSYSIMNQKKESGPHITKEETVDPKYMTEDEASRRLSDFYGLEKFAYIFEVENEANGYLLDDQIIVKVQIKLGSFISSERKVPDSQSLVESNRLSHIV